MKKNGDIITAVRDCKAEHPEWKAGHIAESLSGRGVHLTSQKVGRILAGTSGDVKAHQNGDATVRTARKPKRAKAKARRQKRIEFRNVYRMPGLPKTVSKSVQLRDLAECKGLIQRIGVVTVRELVELLA